MVTTKPQQQAYHAMARTMPHHGNSNSNTNAATNMHATATTTSTLQCGNNNHHN